MLLLFTGKLPYAQYTLNGSATQDACNEYTLTAAVNWQGGSVWNNNKINITQSFDFNFDIFLGNNDGGADGIAFVLQPISTSVGSGGGGMGYEGITPAVGVTIDTYQNGINNDPVFDHIAFQLNGDINHNTANNIAGPVTVINGNDNIEDGNWHSLHIIWNAVTKTLTAYVDGSLRLTAVKDFVTDVFSGDPFVYWGFTGATGGLNNLQKFKTALNPSFHFSPTQKRCVNVPITFYDSTISFTPIVKFWWNFGDGSPIDSVNLNPVHTYTAAGVYTVQQRVRGADGCEAFNNQNVTIGTKPFAAMKKNIDSCANYNTYFFDSSYSTVGTIGKWYWDFDNAGITSTLKNPVTIYPVGGYKNVRLAVASVEGCESDTITKVIKIKSAAGNINFTDSVCLSTPTLFFANINVVPDGTLQWSWIIDGNLYNVQNPVVTFPTAGTHFALFFGVYGGTSPNSGQPPTFCATIITKNIFVVDKPHAAIKNNTICQFEPTVLQDSSYTTDGFAINSYWWDLGNGQFSTQQYPLVTYTTYGPVTIKHVVTNARGCISDTVYKSFFIKPKPDVSFNFNDACKNDVVSFTATDNTGAVTQWQWSFGDGSFANTKDTQHIYTANGTYRVMLVAIAPNACYNDTLRKNISIYSTNAYAGKDTIAAAGQPVQLQATGGISYLWSPAAGLNNANIANPVARLNATQTFTVKAFSPAGCETYDDVKIEIYLGPDIYLPNAFTPNGDSKNDIYRGKPVGLREFKFLKIFNRYGQEIFFTTDYNRGWDGTFKGKMQNSGIYIVIASGVDYRGNVIDKKETVMLIR